MMGEEKRDEYGDPIGGPKISKKQLKKNLASNEKDEDHTTTTAESKENINEVSFKLLKRGYTKSFMKMTEPDKLYKGGVYGRFKKDPETGKSIVKGFQGDTGKVAVMSQGQAQYYKFKRAAKRRLDQINKDITKAKTSFDQPDAKRPPINPMEEVIHEDDMKGMSVKSGHKRPTKSGAGMTAKGVAAYRRRNPGSKLQTAVTGKVKKGSKDAKRRKSYCARSAGQMKKFPKAAKDPNSRLRQARRRWKC